MSRLEIVAAVAAGIVLATPTTFFSVVGLRGWLAHRRPAPAPAAREVRVPTEGDRAWSDIYHADWKARHRHLDVQALWDARGAAVAAADPHPPG